MQRAFEKSSGRPKITSMDHFNKFIDDCASFVLPFQMGNILGLTSECPQWWLWSFLLSGCCIDKFKSGIVKRLPRPTSDHYLIHLILGIQRWGPSYLKFENMWMDHPTFANTLKVWWLQNQLSGWAGHGFIQKLEDLRLVLKLGTRRLSAAHKPGKPTTFWMILVALMIWKNHLT